MLAKELKTGTKRSHTAAENTKFVGSFLRGVVSEENYRTLIKDFYFVYSAIEEEMERLKDDEFLNPIYFKELNRLDAIKKDLRYFYGPNWLMEVKPSEGCIQYVERIHEVADQDPYLLVGHHYTRYLGDLSGGQILKGIAEKALDLPKGEGLHFYEFPDINDKKEFKTKYRSGLDKVTNDSSKMNDIIAEANYAFRLNMYLFDELSGTTKDAINSAAKVFIQTLVGAFTNKK
jgi:heme oxygenase